MRRRKETLADIREDLNRLMDSWDVRLDEIERQLLELIHHRERGQK